MKILLVYPKYPDTFWSLKYVLKAIHKKATCPPLGALTVAAMLPAEWEKKLVDMNVSRLTDKQLKWADYVFISAMTVQRASTREVISRCKKLGVKTVAGGPLFTQEYDDFPDVDHFVLGEAEITLPLFLADLGKGCPQPVYTSNRWPDITKTPMPMWSLVNPDSYMAMSVQYSRGCPFDCEFCDIVLLNGHTPRTKSKAQLLAELEAIRATGWTDRILIVDDNFIGNKRKLKEEILPAMIEWMEHYNYPFTFQTEASINLSDDEELMSLMAKAGFNTIFIGIETPNEDSLVECNKAQNTKRDLADSVKTIINHGFEVLGGFIVGFDSDTHTIFNSQVSFIQKTGIVTAMVGLLNAPRGTRLYHRLVKEDRLIKGFTGDNTDFSTNFVPRMGTRALIAGYQNIMSTIYSPRHYYERIKTFFKEFRPPNIKRPLRVKLYHIRGFISTIWLLGVIDKGRFYWWKLFFSTILRKPKATPYLFGFSLYGLHFRKIFNRYIRNGALQTD